MIATFQAKVKGIVFSALGVLCGVAFSIFHGSQVEPATYHDF